ncbi:MAG: hypothetical protein IPK76_23240 [Lewinellaceae bacterium]|nr:hypothetical protein [Lewinellaceae bacterium]
MVSSSDRPPDPAFFPAMDEIPQHAVAITGYNDKAADAFRKELYGMGWSFGNMPWSIWATSAKLSLPLPSGTERVD